MKFTLFVTGIMICLNTFSQIPLYGKFEKNFNISTLSNLSTYEKNLINSLNPFDKEQIYLQVLITKPQGNTVLNGFINQDFNISNRPTYSILYPYLNRQNVVSSSSQKWSIRYCPDQIGTYQYQYKFILPARDTVINVATEYFSCIKSKKKSFISISSNKNFVYNDGTSFLPIGMNIAAAPNWEHEQPKTNYYELFFNRLSSSGGNFARIWIDFYGGIYFMNTNSNNYEKFNLSSAYVLDRILDLADLYNIKIQLCMLAANNFEGPTGNNVWNTTNPFNTVNGGTCDEPLDFLDINNVSTKIQENYFKYLVDRYGYSTSILSWQLFNEVDGIVNMTFNASNKQKILSWHQHMYSLINNHDPYKHLITTSFASGGNNCADIHKDVFSIMDYSVIHRYVDPFNFPHQTSTDIWKEGTDSYKSQLNKPVIIGETASYGHTIHNFQIMEEVDTFAYVFKHDVWSSLFLASSGIAHYWNWDVFIKRNSPNMESSSYMNALGAINNYINISGFNTDKVFNNGATSNNQIKCYYKNTTDKKSYWGYIVNSAYLIANQNDNFNPSTYVRTLNAAYRPAWPLNQRTISVPSTLNGYYNVEWYSTSTGTRLHEVTMKSSNNMLQLKLTENLLQSQLGDVTFKLTYIGANRFTNNKKSLGQVMTSTDITFNDNNLLYVNEIDGKFWIIQRDKTNNHLLNENTLSGNQTVGMKLGALKSIGYSYDHINGNITYVGYNGYIYRLRYNHSNYTWSSSVITQNNTNIRTRFNSLTSTYDSQVHEMGGNVYFIRQDGSLMVSYSMNGVWYSDWLNGNAPKALPGSSFVTDHNSNSIFYVNTNNDLTRIYYTSSGWAFSVLSTDYNAKVRTNSNLKMVDNKVSYIRLDGSCMLAYQESGNWQFNWFNADSPSVLANTRFTVTEDNEIYYIDNLNRFIKLYFANGWKYEILDITNQSAELPGSSYNLYSYYNNVYYVTSQKYVNHIEEIYTIPFSDQHQTITKQNNWNVTDVDNSDVTYKIHLGEQTKFDVSLCNSTTNFDTKLEIFRENGQRVNAYNDNSNCFVNSTYSFIDGIELDAGYYYIVVDGTNKGRYAIDVNFNYNKSYIEESELESYFKIYPNPIRNELLVIESLKSFNQVTIYDLQGSIVYSNNETRNEVRLELKLNPGVYIVDLLFDDNSHGTSKLIAQ